MEIFIKTAISFRKIFTIDIALNKRLWLTRSWNNGIKSWSDFENVSNLIKDEPEIRVLHPNAVDQANFEGVKPMKKLIFFSLNNLK